MALGLLDLSIVTDRLLKQLDDCTANSSLWAEEPTPPAGTPINIDPGAKFTINSTGLPPDVANGMGGCQLSLYLFHVAPDKFNRNTFPQGGPARRIPQQPLAITLYYLLSAHSKNSYIQEQQAMSIAIKCFHDHPIVNATVPSDNRVEEFTLTMEPESVDEIGRLWQSISSPLRLSTVYRASVIFLEPEVPILPPSALVLRPNVTAVTIRGGPHAVVSFATVTRTGLATIVGSGFVAGSIQVQIGAIEFRLTTTTPPEAGRFCVVSPTQLELQFPSGTPMPLTGKYLLRVRLDPEQPTAEVWLTVP